MKNSCNPPLATIYLVAILLSLPIPATPQQFTRVTQGPPVNDGGWSFGVSWIDYDNDGLPDLHINNWIPGGTGAVNRLYHNNGDGTYVLVTGQAIATDGGSVASTWGDFDNDGDLDAYATCPRHVNYFYVNEGGGTFRKATYPLGNSEDISQEPSWVDVDADGDLDLFVANHRFPGVPSTAVCALYRNDSGSFSLLNNTDIGLIEDEGGAVVWWDYDNDGDSDVLWSRNQDTAVFFDNDGDGTFTERMDNELVQLPPKYHFSTADLDNDGDLDVYADASYPGAPLLCKNMGGGEFELVTGQDISSDIGYWSGGYWGDYDNDGYLDLLIVAHSYYNPHPNRLYHNNGDGTFTSVANEVVASDNEPSSSAAWADHDRDGDLDLFVANVNNFNNALYTNNGNGNAWLQITLAGTRSNRSAIGAKIRLKAAIGGQPMWQLREIRARNGFFAQDDLTAHFGLGDAALVDSIKVEWPCGTRQLLTNIAVRQRLEITETKTTAALLQAMSAAFRGDCIEVTWTLGAMDKGLDFEVRRGMIPGDDFAPARGEIVERNGAVFAFRDTCIERGAAYRYQVWFDDGGTKKVLFETNPIAVPEIRLDLRQNAPNPFNPRTNLHFDIPAAGSVRLAVYDAAGRLVRTLLDTDLSAGTHGAVWDGRDERGRDAASGVHFARLLTGGRVKTVRMTLVR